MKILSNGLAAAVVWWASGPGCVQVGVDPIEVKPIHVTVDINVKVQRELDDFFDFEDRAPASRPESRPTSGPSSSPPVSNP